ncbi:ATP-dependent DNA ligase [Agrococcus versicolor]|uniref:DNA ligase (ATP) n=1 Tax=Agrococcus versicolor TaxID=501482 RepID=A0ABP5MLG0_9MICO
MAEQSVRVGGRMLGVSNLDKVLYPDAGTTKADVMAYLQEVAPAMLPHVRDRPVTRKRWVHGVGTADDPGEVFFVKALEQGAPSWIPHRPIEHKDGPKEYPLVEDAATLAWLAQMASLELHVPQWRFGPDGARRDPDRLVLDLDPGEGAGLPECQEVALRARELLVDMGLRPLPVTSGSKGIHLYARIDGLDATRASALAKAIAVSLEELHPDLVVSSQRKTSRVGKVLVDWSQNSGAKTTVAPYSLRGRPTPTVAAPRTWREIESDGLAQLTYEEVLARVARDGDLLAPLAPPPMVDRLAVYRQKRAADRTPEPVPDEAPQPTYGRSFVIHEHHASSLHWDLRLEHDGVLLSWAIPKGIPTSGEKDRLAVRTEDHPLEYGRFEGVIPKGEYGAGEIRIWDAGDYTVKDWDPALRAVTLHGRPDGGLGGAPVRIALVQTDGDQWLCHRMRLPSAPAERSQRSRGAATAPRSLDPMLASTATLADVGDGWVFEPKWDGWRAIVVVDGDDVRLRSRSGQSLTEGFGELRDPIRQAVTAERAVLDGELVAGAGGGDFASLQGRLGDPRRRGRAVDRGEPVTLVLFDALEVDGRSLLRLPLAERREELERVVVPSDRVAITEQLVGSTSAIVEASQRLGIEGLVAKRLRSTYQPGARSDDWRKVVHVRTHEVAVVGWLPGTGSSGRTFGSLVLAAPTPDGGGLRYAGRVGTGFSARDRAVIRERLPDLTRASRAVADVPADVTRAMTWMRAAVGEVRFTGVTEAGSFRQPVWRGLRADKSLDDLEPLPPR